MKGETGEGMKDTVDIPGSWYLMLCMIPPSPSPSVLPFLRRKRTWMAVWPLKKVGESSREKDHLAREGEDSTGRSSGTDLSFFSFVFYRNICWNMLDISLHRMVQLQSHTHREEMTWNVVLSKGVVRSFPSEIFTFSPCFCFISERRNWIERNEPTSPAKNAVPSLHFYFSCSPSEIEGHTHTFSFCATSLYLSPLSPLSLSTFIRLLSWAKKSSMTWWIWVGLSMGESPFPLPVVTRSKEKEKSHKDLQELSHRWFFLFSLFLHYMTTLLIGEIECVHQRNRRRTIGKKRTDWNKKIVIAMNRRVRRRVWVMVANWPDLSPSSNFLFLHCPSYLWSLLPHVCVWERCSNGRHYLPSTTREKRRWRSKTGCEEWREYFTTL